MGTNRLESFSDGVMAVAITLLVLALVPPTLQETSKHSLVYELGRNWPHYLAYVISFMTIGIIWINHHAMISRLTRADHPIMILNLLLLMSIAVLPFATELMATYLRQSDGQKLAAAIYSAAFLVMSLAFSALNRHVLLRKSHMLRADLSLERRQQILSRALTGLIPYAFATAIAFVSPYATLAICAAMGVFYSLPVASGSESTT
jgi:uncharacterized membrane protein